MTRTRSSLSTWVGVLIVLEIVVRLAPVGSFGLSGNTATYGLAAVEVVVLLLAMGEGNDGLAAIVALLILFSLLGLLTAGAARRGAASDPAMTAKQAVAHEVESFYANLEVAQPQCRNMTPSAEAQVVRVFLKAGRARPRACSEALARAGSGGFGVPADAPEASSRIQVFTDTGSARYTTPDGVVFDWIDRVGDLHAGNWRLDRLEGGRFSR